MKTYEIPEAEVICLDGEDIIRTSDNEVVMPDYPDDDTIG